MITSESRASYSIGDKRLTIPKLAKISQCSLHSTSLSHSIRNKNCLHPVDMRTGVSTYNLRLALKLKCHFFRHLSASKYIQSTIFVLLIFSTYVLDILYIIYTYMQKVIANARPLVTSQKLFSLVKKVMTDFSATT